MASAYHADTEIAVQHNNMYKTTNAYLKKHGHVNIHCRNKVAGDGRLIVEDRRAAVDNNIGLKELLKAACKKSIEEQKQEREKKGIITIHIHSPQQNNDATSNQASQAHIVEQ